MLTRDELRQLKKETSEALAREVPALMSGHPDIPGTDPRIGEYLCGVADHPEGHNLYEQLGALRFCRMSERYEWDAGRVRKFIRFYEALRFSGTGGRRRYRLTPVQTYFFAGIFGYRSEGARLAKNVYLFVPRKFSKTTSVASLAVYDMLFGDNNAQAYVGANSYDQAKICFDEIRNIMRDIDPRQKHIRINREKIFFTDRGRDSFVRCLSSNARTGDGLNASLVIMDEYAQARDTAGQAGSSLKNVLTSSMGARREPLTVVMTTASDVVDGPFARELEGVEAVLRGERENDGVFALLFMPDVDDKEDDPATWRKVQPHLGITVQPDFYEREWANAQLSADNMMVFRTKMLNIFTTSERESWIGAETARKAFVHLDLTKLTAHPDAMAAIDLSERNDFSAVSIGVYDKARKSFFFHTAYFFPEDALKGHPNERMYRIWAEEGHLRLTPGSVIDYRTVVEYILDMNRYVRILGIGYDPWKSLEVVNMLAAAGADRTLRPVRQTYGYFTAPVESFEHGLRTGHVFMNDNPINSYCFGNAVLDEDNLENKKPIKRSLPEKIDGVITMLMCMRLFIDFER